MEHHFNVDIAKEHGINVAIFLNNVAFWIQKNQANKKHFYEGRYWTYNSSEALSILFPYWSVDQLDRIIKKCVSAGLLLLNNFNENKYDRTRWYSLSDAALKLFSITLPRNRGRQTANSKTPSREIAGYIKETDNKPDNKPKRAMASVDKSDLRSKAARASRTSLNLITIPYDFFPDEKSLVELNKHSARTKMTTHEILGKFFTVHRKYKTKSKDWQLKFREFIEKELPKRTFENKQGKIARYDDKPLY